MANIAIAY